MIVNPQGKPYSKRDGAALCRFLSWLSREAPAGRVDELSAIDKLYEFRAENDLFQGFRREMIEGFFSQPYGCESGYNCEGTDFEKFDAAVALINHQPDPEGAHHQENGLHHGDCPGFSPVPGKQVNDYGWASYVKGSAHYPGKEPHGNSRFFRDM